MASFASKRTMCPMMAPSLMALVAEKGAGKSYFVEAAKRLLPNKHIASIRFSDPLRNILAILNKETTRANMQALGTALRTTFGDDGILNDAMRKYIAEARADLVFLDGIRKREEAILVHELGGTIIYISAHPHIRFERRRWRAENPDELHMDWEQFLQQDNAATEISIREIGEQIAHIHIENNDTIEEFEYRIRNTLFRLFPDKV